jgi:hypothetical protein
MSLRQFAGSRLLPVVVFVLIVIAVGFLALFGEPWGLAADRVRRRVRVRGRGRIGLPVQPRIAGVG